jgi:hypothetical protein
MKNILGSGQWYSDLGEPIVGSCDSYYSSYDNKKDLQNLKKYEVNHR